MNFLYSTLHQTEKPAIEICQFYLFLYLFSFPHFLGFIKTLPKPLQSRHF
jgi:hypothetical protein